MRWQSDLGDGSFDSSAVSYVTPGLGKKVRFCQVFQEDQLFTGTITEGDKVCQYINTENKKFETMAQEAQNRVQTAIRDFVNSVDRSYLRGMEREMHLCAASCCENTSARLF